ncbi:MAG: sigma-70 family RNA polymerase sigma factor [Lamprobacter sp.]|uniref:RNA polymerase sigma factor n=1 Tax=Lamprobacter sp. TaxID=3100796 RepID=UPI002B259ED8|nr:sigma-70 family RNA polymerase sigma factor [Lamprobacter sp.]MEA3643176.1 sigma-70 family RNA polymerase sigma factor [Lamprobacter sp.]
MSNHTEQDEVLLQAAGCGDMTAFARLVERHQAWAWRVAYRFAGNQDDAAEIVQEAFLRLLDASGRYRPSAQFRTYFYRIISRLCLDRARKHQPVLLDRVPDQPDPAPSAAERMMRQETAFAVRAALVLRYEKDLGYQEIAAAMGITAKAAERLLARGRERLRRLLGSREGFFDA